MSVSTLSKFTVPIPGASSQGLLMPKLRYRFRTIVENFGITTPRTEITKQVMNITRPNATFENQILDVYNSRINILGKYTWETVQIILRDDANGEMTRRVGEQVQKQFDYFEQASAVAGQDYKFVTKFDVLDGGNGTSSPVVLEAWELYGCYIESANYAEMDYASSEAAQIQLTIRFDNAVHSPTTPGVGAPVPRPSGSQATGNGGGAVTAVVT